MLNSILRILFSFFQREYPRPFIWTKPSREIVVMDYLIVVSNLIFSPELAINLIQPFLIILVAV